MGTTREDIRGWLERAKKAGATHMLVVCDTYDHEEYPVEVKPSENVQEVYKQYQGPNMQRVMECYNLKLDIEKQLLEHRAFNF